MPKIVWTDSMARRLFAVRGTPSATPIAVNREKVWAELCAAPKKIGSKARGTGEESAAKELTRPKSPPDAESMTLAHEVARAKYLRVHMRYNTGGNYPRDVTPNQMIDFWVASKGLLFATEALIATVSGKVIDDYDRPRNYELRRDAFPWGRFRHHLAVADDATWKAARALADKARKKAGDDLATALAFAFPEEPAWASKIAKGAVTRGYGELCVLAAVRDTKLLRALAKKLTGGGYQLYENGFLFAPAMLETLGPDGYDIVQAWVHEAYNASGKRFFSELLSCVQRVEVARFFAEHIDDPTIAGAALPYFNAAPELALEVLPAVVAKNPKSAAAKVLAAVKARGTSKKPAAKGPSTSKLPAFFSAETLARPKRVDGKKVDAAEIARIGEALVKGDEAAIAPLVRAYERGSLAEMAWDIFNAWQLVGCPSDEAWALRALGPLGDDETARRLTPLLRAWPGESAHARAVVGLDVLARIGSDVALMHLHGIAQKLKFKGLQDKAREKIAQIAKSRGLSPEELADRLVPTLDLEPDGSRSLDFGPRAFRVSFDELLRPFVRDGESKKLSDLPKPSKSDDAKKAAAAIATWKALKKDARAVASGQVLRLELAMCARRRWSVTDFRTLLVEHPLVSHLVRRLVWSEHGARGKLRRTFRVAEDGTYADVSDARVDLAKDARIEIPHALALDEGTRTKWGEVLGEYELLQPFAQLGRPTFEATTTEKAATEIKRFEGTKVPTGRVAGLVDRRGWRRGAPQDSGGVWWMEKPLGAKLYAALDIDPGIASGDATFFPEQTLHGIRLCREGAKGPRWGELDPVLLSEVLSDVAGLGGG